MCGIIAVARLDGRPVGESTIRRMAQAVRHRGPDGEGIHLAGPVALGHRRLAIIDLTPAAAQPMTDPSGLVAITYNGEIYNYRDLRRELESAGHHFHSSSDTEVALHAYVEWGDACVERFDGMFALVIHDRRVSARAGATGTAVETAAIGAAGAIGAGGGARRGAGSAAQATRRGRLFVARDRYGVKPLYWWLGSGLFAAVSEIKSLQALGGFAVRLCYPALGEYFSFQNIFSDLTLFEGVRMLPPGCTLSIDLERAGEPALHRYWDYDLGRPERGLSAQDCAQEVYRLFDRAIHRQLVADVPVGSYLSGGMDSGSITAVASRHIPRIHTFSAGFDLSSAHGLELGFDERPAAELMANAFKTEHYEVVLHGGDMEHVLPALTWHLEDLRVGQSYPNFYAARLASRFVKVVLSGGGGDELFAGYPWRYHRGATADGPEAYYRSCYTYWQRLVREEDRARFFTEDTCRRLSGHDPYDAFRQVFAGHAGEVDTVEGRVNASLYFELKTFLHGLLVVEDKLSMAHSLETRVPFLDNALVDFALRIPPSLKLRELGRAPAVDENSPGKKRAYDARPDSDGKVVLRDALKRLLPEAITRRAKQGFSAPDASWFRGESNAYVKELLGSPSSRIRPLIRAEAVDRVLDEHMGGRINHRLLIWSLLSFEWWLRRFDVSL